MYTRSTVHLHGACNVSELEAPDSTNVYHKTPNDWKAVEWQLEESIAGNFLTSEALFSTSEGIQYHYKQENHIPKSSTQVPVGYKGGVWGATYKNQ